jgi:hypothetical protein
LFLEPSFLRNRWAIALLLLTTATVSSAGLIVQSGPRCFGCSDTGGGGAAGLDVGTTTVTFTGSGFGTKSTVAPLYWSTFESYAVDTEDLDTGFVAYDTPNVPPADRPTVKSDRGFSGSKSLRMVYPTGPYSSDGVFPKTGITIVPGVSEIYINCQVYWARTAGSGGFHNFKWARAGTGTNFASDYYHGQPQFHETLFPNTSGQVPIGSDNADVGYVNNGSSTYDNDVNQSPHSGTWSLRRYQYRQATSGGFFRTFVARDGIAESQNASLTGQTADSGDVINWVIIPFDGMDSYGTTNEYTVWIDDVWIDSTPHEVWLTNADTWAGSTRRVQLKPTSWSDGEVVAERNDGLFTSGNTVYGYIVNGSGTRQLVGSDTIP